jgi:Flp pilus assembly protein TadD
MTGDLAGLLDFQANTLQAALHSAFARAAKSFARLCERLPALGQVLRPKGTDLSRAHPFAPNQRTAGVLFFSLIFLLPLTLWLWQSPLRIVRAKLAYGLASQQLARGNRAEAMSFLENSIRLDPDLAIAYNDIGTIYYQWGWVRQARQAFQQAVAADPASAIAVNNLGLSYLEEGQLARALESLQQAVVLDPENVPAWANLGLASHHMGQREEAADAYRAALRLDPLQVTARANLGLLYYEQGRFAEAQEELEAALHAQPDLPAARVVLGALAMEAGDQATARNAFDAVVPVFAGDPVYHFYLGLWHERADDRAQSELELARARAMQSHPDLAALVHSHLVYLAPSEGPSGPDR